MNQILQTNLKSKNSKTNSSVGNTSITKNETLKNKITIKNKFKLLFIFSIICIISSISIFWPIAIRNSLKLIGYIYSKTTLPTGKEELNLFNLTPSKEPAQIILYGLSLSQKYLSDVIKFSETWT